MRRPQSFLAHGFIRRGEFDAIHPVYEHGTTHIVVVAGAILVNSPVVALGEILSQQLGVVKPGPYLERIVRVPRFHQLAHGPHVATLGRQGQPGRRPFIAAYALREFGDPQRVGTNLRRL